MASLTAGEGYGKEYHPYAGCGWQKAALSPHDYTQSTLQKIKMAFPIVLNLAASRERLGKCFRVVFLAHFKAFLSPGLLAAGHLLSLLPLLFVLHKASSPIRGIMGQ